MPAAAREVAPNLLMPATVLARDRQAGIALRYSFPSFEFA